MVLFAPQLNAVNAPFFWLSPSLGCSDKAKSPINYTLRVWFGRIESVHPGLARLFGRNADKSKIYFCHWNPVRQQAAAETGWGPFMCSLLLHPCAAYLRIKIKLKRIECVRCGAASAVAPWIRAYACVCATRTATAAKESMLVYLRAMRNRSFCANDSFSGPAMLANVPNACNVWVESNRKQPFPFVDNFHFSGVTYSH